MAVDDKLSKYCKGIIEYPFYSHPYFSDAINANGTVDVKKFQQRYQTFLSDKRLRRSLSDTEKKVLLGRAGIEGYQKTQKEIGAEMRRSGNRVFQIETKALRKLLPRSNGGVLDALYLEEFEATSAKYAKSKDFDLDYINRIKSQAAAKIMEEEEKTRKQIQLTEENARHKAHLTEYGIQHLGLSSRTNNSLLRGGVDVIDQLEEKSDEELLKIRNVGVKSIREVRERLEAYHKQRKP
ncbi:MAG: DNA-directed RNA polymerase subunit alpha C-terminal domain-containing protein [Candidatus Aenigmatarchaeota archaeon]